MKCRDCMPPDSEYDYRVNLCDYHALTDELLAACRRLVVYRACNDANFQLEKADDYFREIAGILAKADTAKEEVTFDFNDAYHLNRPRCRCVLIPLDEDAESKG